MKLKGWIKRHPSPDPLLLGGVWALDYMQAEQWNSGIPQLIYCKAEAENNEIHM